MERLRLIFRAENFTYPNDYTKSASLCRWQSSSRINGWFVLYRVLMAALFVSILVRNDDWNKFFIFLTDLGYLGLMFHFVISAAVTIEQLFYQSRENDCFKATWLVKVSWVFYTMANLVPIIISIVFWVALFDPKIGMTPYDFLLHGVNSIGVLVDLFLGARPLYFLHVYQSIIALVSYAIFTLIYWAAGGLGIEGEDWIYPIIKWDEPGNTMIVVAVLFVATFVLQGVFVGLHLLRDYIYTKCIQRPLLDEAHGIDNVVCER